MHGKKMIGTLVIMVFVFILSANNVLAEPCDADTNCDEKVNLTDLVKMKSEFLRDDCDPCPASAPVAKTGQTTSWATGDNGHLQTGVAWPIPRFTDNLDGTVTDNLTGLIWLQRTDCFLGSTWNGALSSCNGLADGEYNCAMSGSFLLTDGSSPGDWRLSQRFELESLLNLEYVSPALSNTEGTGQLPAYYPNEGLDPFFFDGEGLCWVAFWWTSTTFGTSGNFAFSVNLCNGEVTGRDKTNDVGGVWCVRGPAGVTPTTTSVPQETVLPVVPTECPEIPTECPVDPTICQLTVCPEVPTECPVIATACPEVPTECPPPTTTSTTTIPVGQACTDPSDCGDGHCCAWEGDFELCDVELQCQPMTSGRMCAFCQDDSDCSYSQDFCCCSNCSNYCPSMTMPFCMGGVGCGIPFGCNSSCNP